MLLHKNNKLIYNNRAASQLPNNVYIDPNPDPCPIEGLVLYSADQLIQIQYNFIETSKDARTFLEEIATHFESFKCLTPTSIVHINGLEGVSMTYSLKRESYEEYVFVLPGEEPALLNVWLEQKMDAPADATQYDRLKTDVLAGIVPMFNIKMDELGRIAFPNSMWRSLGIYPRDKVACTLENDKIYVKTQQSINSMERTVDGSGHIILPKIYREHLLISAPCTLRATVKDGHIVIKALH